MNTVAWIALAVSAGSACFAGVASWTSRERLRLDLYNRRFEIYSRTLDFYHALLEWKPTESERMTTSLQDSPELRTTHRVFIKEGGSVYIQGCFGDQDATRTDSLRLCPNHRIPPRLSTQVEWWTGTYFSQSRVRRMLEAIPRSNSLIRGKYVRVPRLSRAFDLALIQRSMWPTERDSQP